MLGLWQGFFRRQPCPPESQNERATSGENLKRGAKLSPYPEGVNVNIAEQINSGFQHSNLRIELATKQVTTNVWRRQAHSSLEGLLDMSFELDTQKEDFLRVYGIFYGYDGQLEGIHRTEFSRLAGQAYLDYAGAALYSESQIHASSMELVTTLFCNPHSAPTSASADAMAALRKATLELLNADGRQYEVVFTSGATSALKMVAECFPWRAGESLLAHPSAVHNSVLGMRGPAMAAGAAVQLVQLTSAVSEYGHGSVSSSPAPEGSELGEMPPPPLPSPRVVAFGSPMTAAGSPPAAAEAAESNNTTAGSAGDQTWHLLALTAECNFTGDREPLADVVRHVKQYGIAAVNSKTDVANSGGLVATGSSGGGYRSDGRWAVLLDAAKACATAPPDLSDVPADFVVLSFYKIFGYPTGLGALVARKDALALLAAGKSYFGGGTLEVSVADRPYHIRRSGAPGFEDGTPAFTSIAAARHGFTFLNRLGGLPAVHLHSCCLARWLATSLGALRHANGASVVVLYGKWCAAAIAAAASSGGTCPASFNHGPTLSFNLLRPDGSWVGYAEVGRLAAMHGLHLRTGCFCNPGSCSEWLGLRAEDLIRHHKAGHVCWDDHDLVDGRPTGAVRVSLGAASSFEDVYALLQLVRRYFVDDGGGGRNGGRDYDGPSKAQEACAGTVVLSMPRVAAEDRVVSTASGKVGKEAEAGAGQRPLQLLAAHAPTGPTASVTAPLSGLTQIASHSLQPPVSQEVQELSGHARASRLPEKQTSPRMETVSRAHVSYGDSVSACRSAVARPGDAGSSGIWSPRISVPGLSSTGLHDLQRTCSGAAAGRLTRILLYPVKSCAAQEVTAWPIGPTGLLYDREWALVDDSGKVLTLKQCPRMALVRPIVDLSRGTLTIHAPNDFDIPPLELAIPGLFRNAGPGTAALEPDALTQDAAAMKMGDASGDHAVVEATALTAAHPEDVAIVTRHYNSVRLDAGLTLERVQVCGDTVCSDLAEVCHGSNGDARVRKWFAGVLGAPGRIVQQRTGARKVRRPAGQRPSPSSPTPSPASSSRIRADTLQKETLPQQRQQQPRLGHQWEGSGGGDSVEVRGITGTSQEPAVGFANDGQYLLISEASLGELRERLRESSVTKASIGTGPSYRSCSNGSGSSTVSSDGGCTREREDDLVARLRPNLVVSGFPPYEEDGWAAVQVGQFRANVLGTCPRCELLQVDPRAGVRSGAEVLVALAQYRRRGGRVHFGVLLAASPPAAGQLHGTCGDSLKEADQDNISVAPRDTAASSDEGLDGTMLADPEIWLRRTFHPMVVVSVGDQVLPQLPPRLPQRVPE